MHEHVGEHEVDDGVHVGGRAEVLFVVAAEAHVDAVVPVQHRRDAVKSEPVKPARACNSSQLPTVMLTPRCKAKSLSCINFCMLRTRC